MTIAALGAGAGTVTQGMLKSKIYHSEQWSWGPADAKADVFWLKCTSHAGVPAWHTTGSEFVSEGWGAVVWNRVVSLNRLRAHVIVLMRARLCRAGAGSIRRCALPFAMIGFSPRRPSAITLTPKETKRPWMRMIF